jgi:hypothetical protein
MLAERQMTELSRSRKLQSFKCVRPSHVEGINEVFEMYDRGFFGEIAIAALLAAPTIALAHPQPTFEGIRPSTAPIVEKAADVERMTVEKRAEISAE